jgi:ribonuclease VapC
MVVDSSALVAIFRTEHEAPVFLDLIDEATEAVVSMVTIVETMSVLCGRRVGATRNQVDALILRLGLAAEEVDSSQRELAIDALLGFGKGRDPAGLNFGDCFTYALAKARGDTLLFKGDDFAKTDIMPAWRP